MIVGDSYWAFQELDANGDWGTIGVLDLRRAQYPIPLMGRTRLDDNLIEGARRFAVEHAQRSGVPVRFATFVLSMQEEVLIDLS